MARRGLAWMHGGEGMTDTDADVLDRLLTTAALPSSGRYSCGSWPGMSTRSAGSVLVEAAEMVEGAQDSLRPVADALMTAGETRH